MVATGIGFAAVSGFGPLMLVAFVGTLNPSAGDVSVFLPLEQTTLSGAIADRERTDLFARYSMVGSLLGSPVYAELIRSVADKPATPSAAPLSASSPADET